MAKKKTKKKAARTTTKKSTKKPSTPKATKKAAKKASAQKAAPQATKKVATKKTTAKAESSGSKAKSLLGSTVPDISLPVTGGGEVSLRQMTGKNLVLYFYPKDNTPGCTLEGQDFTKLKDEFAATGTEVFGVSADSVKSHEGFQEKCQIKVHLIEDKDQKLCRAFDVIQMKNMYGRLYEGIERSTFVVDSHGKIQGEWRKVKVPGHADEVLDFVKNMN